VRMLCRNHQATQKVAERIQVMGVDGRKPVTIIRTARTTRFGRKRLNVLNVPKNRFNAGFWYTGACRRLPISR
jgi:hypothetical protein